MPDTRTKEADLAAVKARMEMNYAVARHPKFAGNPTVAAALANAKASDAAFLAALAEVDAERNSFRMRRTHRHFRQACEAADKLTRDFAPPLKLPKRTSMRPSTFHIPIMKDWQRRLTLHLNRSDPAELTADSYFQAFDRTGKLQKLDNTPTELFLCSAHDQPFLT
jgi:hypothetical protein